MLKRKAMSAKRLGGSATQCGGNWAVVMAGGRGTRFWPESRKKLPKPFLRLFSQKTLLQETVDRVRPLFPPSRILIVLQQELVKEAKRLLPQIPTENFLGEPVGRNTAPCAVYAASRIAQKDSEAKFVFLPADHLIQPQALFLKSLKAAFEIVDEKPVLFGIPPRWPNPAYGYLEVSRSKEKKKSGVSFFTIRQFHEKPSSAIAQAFVRQGNFFWNSGIFVWRLGSFREAVKTHLPRLYPAFKKQSILSLYRSFPSVSLDYGIMERIKNIHCLRAPFEWSDLGGWPAISEFWPSDASGNRILGKVLAVRSGNNIVKSTGRIVALLGVHDLVVVDTPDALLVCPRNRSEEIRDVVHKLETARAFKYL